MQRIKAESEFLRKYRNDKDDMKREGNDMDKNTNNVINNMNQDSTLEPVDLKYEVTGRIYWQSIIYMLESMVPSGARVHLSIECEAKE